MKIISNSRSFDILFKSEKLFKRSEQVSRVGYHGGGENFNPENYRDFDEDKYDPQMSTEGIGIYVTNNKELACGFGSHLYKIEYSGNAIEFTMGIHEEMYNVLDPLSESDSEWSKLLKQIAQEKLREKFPSEVIERFYAGKITKDYLLDNWEIFQPYIISLDHYGELDDSVALYAVQNGLLEAIYGEISIEASKRLSGLGYDIIEAGNWDIIVDPSAVISVELVEVKEVSWE